MTEIVDIVERLIRCIDNLGDVCEEISYEDISFQVLYMNNLNSKKEELNAARKLLVEIIENQE